MKIKLLLLILLTSFIGFSQTVNDYKAVIVPIKFDFSKGVNPYRLSTLTKSNLIKAGFQAFYDNEQLPDGYSERCELLYVDVKKDNAFLVSKLYVEFKDCFGKVIYTSEIGKSKEKEYDIAYRECLDMAFLSIYKLNYKYNGKKANTSDNRINTTAKNVPVVTSTSAAATATANPVADMTDPNLLYAQPTENGFQLIDKTPKVVMKLLKTSRPDSFIAIKDGIQGTLNAKDNQWFFEYYQNDKLISEKISVKF